MKENSSNLIAGQKAPRDILIDLAQLENAYYQTPIDLCHKVSFGTSGHRGTSLDGSYTEAHVAAITQAVCDYRSAHKINGALFLGKDTHFLSSHSQRTCLEVLAANGVDVRYQQGDGYTPTPVISHAIINANARATTDRLSDGIVITPSHNPPEYAGFKYNPTHGGPAESSITKWIETRANEILTSKNVDVKRMAYKDAISVSSSSAEDLSREYISQLPRVINFDSIRESGVRIGVHPLGGSSSAYWERIAEEHRIRLEVVSHIIDPTFSFMTLDHDGKIRMDCSSPYAMASLIELKDKYDIAFGLDPDADRHGIVTPSAALMNPNHYLAVAINYLIKSRTKWPTTSKIGKTIVSSSMIDRVVASLDRALYEVPVGFKYFAAGLHDGSICFGGEESAGASFLAMDGSAWSSDKDGLIMGLLAAEMTSFQREDPSISYRSLTEAFGDPKYIRIDAPITPEQKLKFANLNQQTLGLSNLAAEPVTGVLTQAPGNGDAIGGIKVITEHGWFAARPSGTEPLFKIYAESFKGEQHLDLILEQAQEAIARATS